MKPAAASSADTWSGVRWKRASGAASGVQHVAARKGQLGKKVIDHCKLNGLFGLGSGEARGVLLGDQVVGGSDLLPHSVIPHDRSPHLGTETRAQPLGRAGKHTRGRSRCRSWIRKRPSYSCRGNRRIVRPPALPRTPLHGSNVYRPDFTRYLQ